jgi:magnesium chelatase family protein
MSLATLYSRANAGIDAPLVTVEVHLGPGLPGFAIVGLPEKAVQESKDRVRGALVNCAFDVPQRKITVNLGPADLPKEGGRFDLPIALGILAASGQLDGRRLDDYEWVGELALSGALRPTRGVLPVALAARAAGRSLLLPHGNASEAALVRDLPLYAAGHLLEVCAHLNGTTPIAPWDLPAPPPSAANAPDIADVHGQAHAKRALEIAAAGGHSLLMIGPPGTGKSMLAGRLPGLLPPMSEAEALETAAVVSLGLEPPDPRHFYRRPFRAPHHSASAAALVGGTGHPRPGEISLAHNGVLFLDELPEFDRHVLEVLREPLETGRILISRAARKVEFPARFQLVAAMNPCPCGYLGDARGAVCSCTPDQIARYRARVSGPLLDRIDMQIEVPAVPADLLGRGGPDGERTALVRDRVAAARHRQLERQGLPNAGLTSTDLDERARLDTAGATLLRRAVDRLRLSARAYHRIIRLALTIADLEGAGSIRAAHVAEAVGYRRLDRGVA